MGVGLGGLYRRNGKDVGVANRLNQMLMNPEKNSFQL